VIRCDMILRLHTPQQTKKEAKKPAAREITTLTMGIEISPAELEGEDVEEDEGDDDELIEPLELDAVSLAIPISVEGDIEPPALETVSPVPVPAEVSVAVIVGAKEVVVKEQD
jgi:hypothetical protein